MSVSEDRGRSANEHTAIPEPHHRGWINRARHDNKGVHATPLGPPTAPLCTVQRADCARLSSLRDAAWPPLRLKECILSCALHSTRAKMAPDMHARSSVASDGLLPLDREQELRLAARGAEGA